MCGRFAIQRNARELADELGATIAAGTDAWTPDLRITPGKDAPVLVEVPDRRLGLARFGLSGEGPGGRLIINARAETMHQRPLFAEPAARRRCLVPVDGFFEWESRGARRVAHYIHADHTPAGVPGGGPLLLGALFEVVHDEETDAKRTRFAIVTVPARQPVLRIHDRMPLVVPRGLADSWLRRGELSPEEALAAIAAATPVPLAMHPVSLTSPAANDDPSALRAIDPDHAQTGLLDFGDDLDERAPRRR